MTSSTVSDSLAASSTVVLAPSDETDSSAEPAPTAGATPSAEPAGSATPTVAPRSSRTMSILALSLGIASLVFAQTVVVPLAAVILGVFGLRDEPAGRNFSIWGIVLACIAAFGWVAIVAVGALISLPFLFLGAF
ncbi:hypothetical protein [Salinibacterium sp. PAMC 21357]|uniref:hypothetical protein n=1 Tax=Salinibacterium sp. PAMC 21357 TaxID=1112215 RepID=UPI000287C03B|nr:hypothetical protein [Salinibacterium sp. PAMC 21357]